MLKNNNGAILRKLTIRSLRSGKMRNLFIMITVALSAALISGLAGFAFGMDKKEERDLAVSPHVLYTGLDSGQAAALSKDGRVDEVISCTRDGAGDAGFETLPLPEGGTGDAGFEALPLPEDGTYSVSVRILDAESMDSDTFFNTIHGLGEAYGIPRHQIFENNRFVIRISHMKASSVAGILAVSAVILFASVFVIYSIFYISVTGRIRQFGQLRTIGMTSRQIRKTVRYEGLLLGGAGSLAGLLLGTAFAYLIVPGGFHFPATVKIWILTLTAVTLTVLFSINKPAKIAAAASPIEASKANDNSLNKSRGKRRLTPFGLARISAGSNRKRSAMTTVSLGIGGLFFTVGTTFIASYNIEEYSRAGVYAFGDYILEIADDSAHAAEHGAADIQINNPLTRELEAEIAAFEGVKGVTRYERFGVQYEYNNYQTKDSILPFESRYLEILNRHRVEGEPFDYERMVRNKEIIILRNRQVDDIYGWKFEIGSQVRFLWYDGEDSREDYFTVAGSVEGLSKSREEDAYYLNTAVGWFLLPRDLLTAMVPDSYDPSDGLIVKVENYKTDTAVKEYLQKYADSDSRLTVSCFADEVKNGERNYYFVAGLVWGLSAFIIGFALINLINTLVSNAMSRRQEFAMLRSIGMSGSQLKKMIVGEGMILAVKNIIITLTLGTAAGYAAIQVFRELAATYLHWHFPGWYLLGYLGTVLVLPGIISAVITNILERKSLTERLREAE